MPEGFDVKGMAVRDGKALLFAGGPDPAPLAEIKAVLQGGHRVIGSPKLCLASLSRCLANCNPSFSQ
jgi:hypothetical protein